MVYLVLSLFCAMGVALFAVQNAHEVRVRFLAWEVNTSLALLVIGAVAAGALLLGLIALFRQVGLGLKLWDERSRARKAVTDLEQARLASQELRTEIDRLQEHNRRLAARLAELTAPGVGSSGAGHGYDPVPAVHGRAAEEPVKRVVETPHDGPQDEPQDEPLAGHTALRG